jgi:bacteriocin-like protein
MSNLQILDLPLQQPNLQELTELELKQVVGGNSLAPNVATSMAARSRDRSMGRDDE